MQRDLRQDQQNKCQWNKGTGKINWTFFFLSLRRFKFIASFYISVFLPPDRSPWWFQGPNTDQFRLSRHTWPCPRFHQISISTGQRHKYPPNKNWLVILKDTQEKVKFYLVQIKLANRWPHVNFWLTFIASSSQQRHQKEQQKVYDYKAPNNNVNDPPRSLDYKKEPRVFEYEYKTSNMNITDGNSSGDRRSSKHGDSGGRFRRHSDSTNLNSDNANSRSLQHRKYSAGLYISNTISVNL